MVDVNSPIDYNWTLGWDAHGLSDPYPIVTPLLKAIIEKDIKKITELENKGADLKKCNSTTFRRVLYHVANDYSVMKWLVDHGMSRISNDIDVNGDNGINKDECYSPSGYCWGLSARAYYLKAYDVFDLLCEHGFSNFSCFDDGWKDSVEVDNYILQRGDERAIKILLSNGYTFSMFSYVKEQQYYEYYVLNRPQVQRKSVGLDSRKWRGDIPRPKFEKVPLLFGKKEIIARNSRRQEDYQDRVRAYNEFVLSFGKDNYRNYVNKKAEFQNKVGDIMIETLKSQGLW